MSWVEEQNLVADLVYCNDTIAACRKVGIFHRMLLHSRVGGLASVLFKDPKTKPDRAEPRQVRLEVVLPMIIG